MQPFEIINHTADTGIKAWGATLTELFENAARGMFAIIACKQAIETKGLKVERNIEIQKTVDGYEELLVAWLSELLYIFNQEKICFNDFRVFSLNNNGITCEAKGIEINPYRHDLYTEIKAVTFHNLKIEEDTEGFNCTIIFDV